MKQRGPVPPRRRSIRGPASLAARALLAMVIVGSALAVGSVHVTVLMIVAAAATICLALTILGGGKLGASPFAWVALVLLAITLLQMLPLPFAWLQRVSPTTAEVWRGARVLVGAPSGSPAPLSLDPGASAVEALKLWTYFCVIVAAAGASVKRGALWGLLVLAGAALVIAITTIAHGVLDATQVFGIYTPRLGGRGFRVAPLINPNNLAGYLNLGLAAGLALLAEEDPPVPRWLMGLSLLPIIVMCVLTCSRAVFFFLAIVIFLSLWLLRPRGDALIAKREAFLRFAKLGAAVLGTAVLMAFVASGSRLWHLLVDDNVAKLDLAKETLPLVVQHRWWGIGRGAFESVFPAVHTAPDNSIYSHPENFLIQWAVEWGLPVTLLLVIGCAACVWAGGFRLGTSTARRGLLAGVCALLFQNLFDLGFEVPGLMIAFVAALGFAARGVDAHSTPRRQPRWQRSSLAAGLVVAAALLELLVLRSGLKTLTVDRDLAREAIPDSSDDASQAATFREAIAEAMMRHPAEPYFPRLGAMVAWHTKQNPLPWLNRALERGMSAGRTHYLLGAILAASNRKAQALPELQTAAELDPSLTRRIAQVAVRLTQDEAELIRTAPEGPPGSTFLLATAGLLSSEQEGVATALVEEAIRRQPKDPKPRLSLVRRLLLTLKNDHGACSGPARDNCLARVRDQLAYLEQQRLATTEVPVWRAKFLVASGQSLLAQTLLESECPKLAERSSCLAAWLEAVEATKDLAALTRVARAVREDGCGTEKSCVSLIWATGEVAIHLGNPELGLAQFEQAAQQDGSAARWRSVARQAQRNGYAARAMRALDRAATLAPEDASLIRERNAVRQSLLKQMAP